MIDEWTTALWRQFGAAIDTLDDAIRACPENLWRGTLWTPTWDADLTFKNSEFWNVCHHTLFWTDLYLFGTGDGFAPPAPFTTEELDPNGKLPERVYAKHELRTYLQYVRETCQRTLIALTDDEARRPCMFPWSKGNPVTYFELQLYNMRHAQEHASQLHLFLGQHNADDDFGWVPSARTR